MNPLPRVSSTLLGLALLLLAACGPTGGGTGTGESAFTPADFGARPASACSAPFAGTLACNAISGSTADVALLPGTDPVVFVGTVTSGPLTLTLTGNQATLQSRCAGPHFDGSWGVLADGQGRYFGSFSGLAGAPEQKALLWLQTQPDSGGGLVLQVQAPDGRVLLGPVPLRRAAGPAVDMSTCP